MASMAAAVVLFLWLSCKISRKHTVKHTVNRLKVILYDVKIFYSVFFKCRRKSPRKHTKTAVIDVAIFQGKKNIGVHVEAICKVALPPTPLYYVCADVCR